MKDEKFKYFQKKILKYLSLIDDDSDFTKSMISNQFILQEIFEKSYPVGTIRTWKGNAKYKKVSPSKWVRIYDKDSTSAKRSIGQIKAMVKKCTTSEELLQLVLKYRDRFSDENGYPIPLVQELHEYVSKRNDEIESEKVEKKEKVFTKTELETLLSNNSVSMPKTIEFSKENFDKYFRNEIDTPIGKVKIGEHQYQKLEEKNRKDLIIPMYETLKNPCLIGETKNGAKLYVKSFSKENGKQKNIVSVVVNKEHISISISTHEERTEQIAKKITRALYQLNSSYHGEKKSPYDGTVQNESVADEKESKMSIADSHNQQDNSSSTNISQSDEKSIENNKKIDEIIKETKEKHTNYYKEMANSIVKKYGEKKLKEYVEDTIIVDEDKFKDKLVKTYSENPSPETLETIRYRLGDYYRTIEILNAAKKRLTQLNNNKNLNNLNAVRVSSQAMSEAKEIIGREIKILLKCAEYKREGKEVNSYIAPNARQTLQDKIKRRARTQPEVCRAMFHYIREVDPDKKIIFTEKNTIWDLESKLNERATEKINNGESETATGKKELYKNDNGISIVENADIGRYQIFFPGKPSYEVISKLKRNGWHWSPSNKAWQRQNTSNGLRSVKNIATELDLTKNETVKKSWILLDKTINKIYIAKSVYDSYMKSRRW